MLTPTPFPLGMIIMGNSQVAFDAVCCNIIGVDPSDGRSHPARRRARLRLDRHLAGQDHRRRHARRGEGAREGLQGRPDPRREVLRGHAHHRVRRPAAGVRGRRLLLGRLPRRDRGGDRDPPRVRQGDRPARCRACTSCSARTTAASTRSPARRSCSSATAPTWKGKIHGKPVAIENLYKDRATLDPHTATSQDIFAKLASAKSKLTGDVDPARGLPGLGRRAGARAGLDRRA